MQKTMSDPWIESAFTITDQFKEKILAMASRYPQAFQVRPKHTDCPKEWARYDFDSTVQLFVDTSHPEAIEFYREHFTEEKEKTMTKALTVQEQQTVNAMLQAKVEAIRSVLPDHISVRKMMRLTSQAVVLTPELARCDQLSLINAVIEASALGLEIGTQAHLLPFRGTVKLIPDYKGLVELAYRSPAVSSITAHPVYDNDRFDYWYGLKSDIQHNPAKGQSRGKLIAAYAIVKFVNGGYDFEVVEEADAMAAKERSEAKNSKYSPWNKEADEWTMWVKTALRRLLKRVPKNPELQKAIILDSTTREDQKINHIIDADFKTIKDIPEEPVTEKPKDEAGKKHTEEELKIIKNYNVAKEMFPEALIKAIERLKLQKAVLTPELMEKIVKTTSLVLDEDQEAV
jgi:recombination protein RecT